ncbi:MAG: hypothetical protein PHT43_01690, partial [Anaerolineaceae bacterium]|nr:hypothetical protein [Anaerolineaceae bacterium]
YSAFILRSIIAEKANLLRFNILHACAFCWFSASASREVKVGWSAACASASKQSPLRQTHHHY